MIATDEIITIGFFSTPRTTGIMAPIFIFPLSALFLGNRIKKDIIKKIERSQRKPAAKKGFRAPLAQNFFRNGTPLPRPSFTYNLYGVRLPRLTVEKSVKKRTKWGGTQKKNLVGPHLRRLGRRRKAEAKDGGNQSFFSSLGPAVKVRFLCVVANPVCLGQSARC